MILAAELSGATSGTVDFDPDPIPGNDTPEATSTGTTSVPGSTSGTVTLDVTVEYIGALMASADVELEGDCVGPSTTAPASTAPSTATAPVAVESTPAFTG
jgi:hypothetical protein